MIGMHTRLESFFGKVLEIDKKTKEYKIISKGHRNPQGLYYNKYRDLIVSTDHGPKGVMKLI